MGGGLRLKLRPQEASKEAGVQEKNGTKILNYAIFEVHKCYTPPKKAKNNWHLRTDFVSSFSS